MTKLCTNKTLRIGMFVAGPPVSAASRTRDAALDVPRYNNYFSVAASASLTPFGSDMEGRSMSEMPSVSTSSFNRGST